MATRLILAPAASGKTRYCIKQVRATLRAFLLSEVWVILPDSHQATAFRRRLAEQGGAIGAHVGTFADLHAEILALACQPIPVAPEPVIHRLALAAIDSIAEQDALKHYASIRRQPGFAHVLTRLIAELKRAQIEPASFRNAILGQGQRLEELAHLYRAYQDYLVRLQWADVEGLGWLAVRALRENTTLANEWKLVIADGFDELNSNQLETLKLLAERATKTLVTLTGEREMKRNAYRRFQRTLARIQTALAPQIEVMDRCTTCHPVLAHLEKSLFESDHPKIDPERAVTFIETQTLVLEAREALHWLKARIQRDGVGAQECAIIAYDLTPYRILLNQAANEFGMALRFAGGEPLISNPAIAAILNLLELNINGWQRRSLLDALRTPYFDRTRFNLTSDDAFRFDQVAHWGHIVQGLAQWQDSFTRLVEQTESPIIESDDDEAQKPPTLPKGDEARRLWENLQAFTNRVIPPERASLIEFVEWLEDLVAANQGLAVIEQTQVKREETDAAAKVVYDTSRRDKSALAAFKDILRALVLSEKIVGERGEMTYADFFTDLRGAVEAATYIPEDSESATQSHIYCASLRQARGVPYRAVVLLGLSEGLFPAPIDEDPFLPDDDRNLLALQGLPIEPRLRSDQQSLFYEAVTRASEFLLLTRPYLADDGETWEPSPYWNAVRLLFDVNDALRIRTETMRPLADCASKVELLTAAVRHRGLPTTYSDLVDDWENLRHVGPILRARLAHDYRGALDGQVTTLESTLEQRYAAQHVWNISALERYANCGFRFLIGDVLQLEKIETPQAGYNRAQLGEMLHAILENVYTQVADPSDLDAVLRQLSQTAEEIFKEAPATYDFRPTLLWEKQCEEMLEQIEKTIRNLADEEAGMRPIGFEKTFRDQPLKLNTPSGTVLFRGRIDRVDQDEHGNLRVIDYKTGVSQYGTPSLREGKHLQIVLYALGAEKALRLGRVEDAFYWGILKGEASSLRLSKFKYTDAEGTEYIGMRGAIDLVTKYIGQYIQDIRRGNFIPIPPSEKCSSYCVAQPICWRYERSDHP